MVHAGELVSFCLNTEILSMEQGAGGSPKVSVTAFQRFQKQQTHQNEAPKRSTGDGSSCCLVEEKGPNQSRCPCLGSSKIREKKY